MDIKQLEYFVRVAELGSFTRASAALDVAQPALSRQVRLLEVELRQTLLLRHGRGAVPTEAGKLLLAHGRGILHQVERAKEELGQVRGSLAGHVAVGLPTSLARVLTVPLTRAFRTQMPDATISITEGLSVTLHEALLTGRLDLAVLYNAQPSTEIEISVLLEEDLLLIQASSNSRSGSSTLGPIALKDIAKLPLVIPTKPNAIRMHVESMMNQAGLRLQTACEVDGVAAILDLVADGIGCAVLPRNAVMNSSKPSAYIARTIKNPTLRSKISLATSALRPTTLTQKTTMGILRETITTLTSS